MKNLFPLIAFLLSISICFSQTPKKYYKKAKEYIEQKDFTEAVIFLNKSLELDAKYFDALVARANALENLKKYPEAIVDLKKALEIEIDNYELYQQTGKIYFKLDQYKEALEMLDRALKFKKNYLDAIVTKIMVLNKMKDFQNSFIECEKALDIKGDAYTFYLHGIVTYEIGNYSTSEYDLRKSLQLSPKYEMATIALIKTLIAEKKYSVALGLSNDLLNNNPKCLDGYILRSKIYHEKMDFSGAIEDLTKAIILNPSDENLILTRGTYNQEFSKHADAINDYSKVISLNNKNVVALNKRGSSYQEISNTKAAIKDFQTILDFSKTITVDSLILNNASVKVFELGREFNKPEIKLFEPTLKNDGVIELSPQQKNISFRGQIADESKLKYIKINDINVKFENNSNANTFTTKINCENLDFIIISVIDIYDNSNKLVLAIKKEISEIKDTLSVASLSSEKHSYNFEKKSDIDINIPENTTQNEYRFALIIGNEDYSSNQIGLTNEVNVFFAKNDASAFKDYAIKTLNIPERNIIFQLDATAGAMNQAISKLSKLAEKTSGNAELFFYYAGHGLPDDNTKEAYIIPTDVNGSNLSSAIKLNYVYTKLTENNPKKVTVFIDACFSGGARNNGLLASRGVKIKAKEESLNGNIVVFTASSGEQSALPYSEKYHGMFTYFLLKKIQETSGNLLYKDLEKYLKEKVDLESVRSNNK